MPTNQKNQDADKDEGPRSFGVWLRRLSGGEAESVLSHDLWDLTKRMQEEMEARPGSTIKGKLSLSINLSAKDGHITVGYDVKTTAPKPARSAAVFWFTKGGNLTAEQPRQEKLPFQDVANAHGMPRDLGGDDDEQPAREA
jgi:hypothetical protein